MGLRVLEFRGETVQEFLVYNGTCVQVQWVISLFAASHLPLNSSSIWAIPHYEPWFPTVVIRTPLAPHSLSDSEQVPSLGPVFPSVI